MTPFREELTVPDEAGVRARGTLKYEPALDGLRGMAILAVVAFHAYSQYIRGGWIGVDIFFVLSGYLITSILRSEISRSGRVDFRNFYMRRVLRLAPAMAGLLLFELVRAAINPALRNQILQAMFFSVAYLMNWNRAFHWGAQDVIGHTWSLSIEEQFYLLWPSVLVLASPWLRGRWIVGLSIAVWLWRGLLVLSGAGIDRVYNGFDTHCDGLLIGAALATGDIPGRLRDLLQKTAFAPLVLLLLAGLFLREDSASGVVFGSGVAAICAAWLILASQRGGALNKVLSARPLVFTGKISYGWYLWHYPILLLGYGYLPKHAGAAILVIASYILAVASFFILERPFLRLKSRFHAKRSRGEFVAPLSNGEVGASGLP